MLDEIAEYVRFADQAGYAGFGHPEHHLQVEGFEISNSRSHGHVDWPHSRRLRVNTVGWVAPAHNPVRTAEYVATLDHMLQGRLGVGFIRGYQARWVHTLRVRPDIPAVGPWNRRTAEDDVNRDYFKEFVDIVLVAWAKDTFSYQGRLDHPDPDFVNPHVQTASPLRARGGRRHAHPRGGHRPQVLSAPAPPTLRRLHPQPAHRPLLGALRGAADRALRI